MIKRLILKFIIFVKRLDDIEFNLHELVDHVKLSAFGLAARKRVKKQDLGEIIESSLLDEILHEKLKIYFINDAGEETTLHKFIIDEAVEADDHVGFNKCLFFDKEKLIVNHLRVKSNKLKDEREIYFKFSNFMKVYPPENITTEYLKELLLLS